MGDIGKAKHASNGTQHRGKHAKHARVSADVVTHPSRIRYAAGTFLVSSAIALGLFVMLPFDASESVDLGEMQSASIVQESIAMKSARVMHSGIEASAQSTPMVQTQSTGESADRNPSTVESDENGSEPSAPERDAEAESSDENGTSLAEDSVGEAASAAQEQSEATADDDTSENAVETDTVSTDQSSDEGVEEPPAPSAPDSDSKPALETEPDAGQHDASGNPSSFIASMVNNYDPDAVETNMAFFGTVIEDKKLIAQDVAQKLAVEPVDYISAVEPQLQEGVLDSGCEIVSLSMALESMGIKADPVDIAEGYLDFEGGMTDGFVGSPYDGGAGFPAGIAKAANAYLHDVGSNRHAYDLTGNSFDVIAGLVSRGYPVLIWTTIDFTEPFFHDVEEGDYRWYGNEHCVLLCGVSDDTVLVCDPLEGRIERDAEQFIEIYEHCGSMALYVR